MPYFAQGVQHDCIKNGVAHDSVIEQIKREIVGYAEAAAPSQVERLRISLLFYRRSLDLRGPLRTTSVAL